MGVLLGESHDDVAEVGEGLVDGLGLGEPQPLAAGVLDSLGAGQVDQVEGAAAGLSALGVGALDLQHEDGVTAAGSLVAERLGPGSVLPGLPDHDLDLILARHLLHLQVGDVHVGPFGVLILHHLDLIFETWVVVEEVSDFLVVDFQK